MRRTGVGGQNLVRTAVQTFLILMLLISIPPSFLHARESSSWREVWEQSSAQYDLQKGIELYRSGQPEEALNHLRGFIIRHPDSPLRSEAYLVLSKIFLDSDQPLEALVYLHRLPEEEKSSQAKLVEGLALIAAGELGRGLDALQSLENADLSSEDRARRFSAMAEGNLRLGRHLQGLFFIHRALSMDDHPDAEKLLNRSHQVMKNQLTEAELAEAGFMFGGTALGEDAKLQLAVRALSRGDEDRALRLAQEVTRSTVSFPYRREAMNLIERLTGKVWLQRAVGVILPLSGRYGTFGELVRRGMDLAIQEYDIQEAPVRFLYRDTGADPEASAKAVSEFSSEGIMVIAGPLTGAASDAAARRAQQEEIPLLALSQKDGLPETGNFVFRNSLTSRLQVIALVRHAMEEQGMETFGILYPENKQGQEMAEIFREEVFRRGGEVSAVQSYAENATDFRRQIKGLQGLDPEGPEKEPVSGGKEEPQSPPPFEALFIPDYADRVGLIVPQIVYYGLEKIQLLGINGWNSPELIRRAGSYVEGAIFVDGFFRYSPYPFVQKFVDLYYKKYGEDPSILEAQGYDVANVLLSLLSRPEIQAREDLREALSRIQNFPGVTGATSFNSVGDAEKVLYLLQVQNGNIVQIN